MGYFADIYVIKKIRSVSIGIEFLNHFIPQRKESRNIYEIENDEGIIEAEFDNAIDVMKYLEENRNAKQNIYWQNVDEENLNRHGMIFFTKDSHMIFGISRDYLGIGNTENEESCLNEMIDFFKTNEGYITYENPPANNYKDFKRLVENSKHKINVTG